MITALSSRTRYYYYLTGISFAGICGAFYQYQKNIDKSRNSSKYLNESSGFYMPLKLLNKTEISPTCQRFSIELPQADKEKFMEKKENPFGSSTFYVHIKEPSAQSYRAFTPIKWTKDQFDIVIRKYPYPMAEVARYLCDKINIGDEIDVHGPHISFDITHYLSQIKSERPGEQKKIGLIAGGTGIAPIIQLLSAFKEQNFLDITLIYAVRSEDELILLDELEQISKRFQEKFKDSQEKSNLNVHIVFERGNANRHSQFTSSSGLIDRHIIKSLLPPPEEKAKFPNIFISGPPGMMKSICGNKLREEAVFYEGQGLLSGILKSLGYSQNQIYKF